VKEIDSSFSFLAVYGGYRLEHDSNGDTSRPNRGWEGHWAVARVSYYFS